MDEILKQLAEKSDENIELKSRIETLESFLISISDLLTDEGKKSLEELLLRNKIHIRDIPNEFKKIIENNYWNLTD